jgi:hypothetical protein
VEIPISFTDKSWRRQLLFKSREIVARKSLLGHIHNLVQLTFGLTVATANRPVLRLRQDNAQRDQRISRGKFMVDKSTQEVLANSRKIKDPEGWTTGVTLS